MQGLMGWIAIFPQRGGGGGGGEGGITSYYILLQHLHIYFSSEDEIQFSRFKSEMDRLKVMNF